MPGRQLTTRDYRLFDIQHAVLPTKLPLAEFYAELVKTQQVLNKKHLGWAVVKEVAKIAAGKLLRGQTNFVKSLWKFDSVYNPKLLLFDHQQSVKYEISLPPEPQQKVEPRTMYIHLPGGRPGRVIDNSTEEFVNETRMGTSV